MKTLLALNTDLTGSLSPDGRAPEWVELIPAGPFVIGRDGRSWLFDDTAQQLVLSSFTERGIDLVIDWEHATQRLAADGKEAPAAAWIDTLDIRDGALWGHVTWTPRAAQQVENKEYRFLSPVFDFIPDNGRIVLFVSAGLTNKPNFHLTALNQEAPSENPTVKISPALLALLGLPETATEEEALAAANQLKTAQATNSEHQNIERFVPRADYDTALSRATNAEQQLQNIKTEQHAKAVDAAIQEASEAGKITPATAEYHRASCHDQAGLDRFKAFVAAAPVVGDPSNLGERKPHSTTTALNAEEQSVCQQFGIDPAEYAKTKQSEG
ncbi:phage protease [Pseudomonas nicosulfuronedens]|uniref:phage protease n=1 Tax=Pseudomonas nicosulfuronedens TaxID=2571105 RepID=UPI00244B71AC|nr:phage protease [Pseudomonas nicosulfuronedens]MDH1009347.1 phage protease [Pseudomonas nicosulfuronedens]MDH1978703.1 phage protease [Pseudomonas nicosulfuronedens]MDH2026435.1 phage protease [Pseudomonas nicosulfuronedens]